MTDKRTPGGLGGQPGYINERDLFSHLSRCDLNPSPQGNGIRSRCPLHPDQGKDVLSFHLAPSGVWKVHCHQGCTFEAIVEALGLEQRQFFPDQPPSPAARRETRATEEKAQLARWQMAANKARRVWNDASPVGLGHPYLERKQVAPSATLREMTDKEFAACANWRAKGGGGLLQGRLLIAPVRKDGRLVSLELIDEDGRKAGLLNSQRKGAYWAPQALPEGDAAGLTIQLTEGVADALSAREATGDLSVAALSCGNLEAVALELKERFARASFVIIGDLGNGEEHARHAARVIGARLCFPPRDLGPKADINDLHCQRGLDAVAAAIAGAAPVEERAPDRVVDSAPTQGADSAESRKALQPFELIEGRAGVRDGLYYHGKDKDGEPMPPEFICSPLRVTARTRDSDGEAWGRMLEWCDPEGRLHRWAMPAEMLSASGEEYRAVLLRGGLEIAPGTRARSHLTTYLQSAPTQDFIYCVERTGWHEGAFVLPRRVIGTGTERVVFQAPFHHSARYGERGALEDWKREVASLCIEQSRLTFCLSTAFASVLLEPVREENGGFHLQGGSSEGKTTALHVAASVFGPRDYLHRWRATSNGLEAIAAAHSGTLLILDELGQIDPREAGEIAYLLANGSGKHRADRTGGARRVQSWRLLFLSSGEMDLATHMQAAGKRSRAGQEIRLLSLAANAGKGFGLFDRLGGFESGAALARALMDRSARMYGTAGPAFIEAVSRELDDIPRQWEAFRAAFLEKNLPSKASGQAYRAAQRFALVGFGGELASAYGLTGWEQGEAEDAAGTCLRAWLEGRGGAGDQEVQTILAQVRRFFEAHGESRFRDLAMPSQQPIRDRAGFRRKEADGLTYYVLPETFREELCRGHHQNTVCRVLEENGMLERGGPGRFTSRLRSPDGDRPHVYKLRPSENSTDS